MEIANPIYDVVFKYLMEDSKAARMLLSAILGKKVINLQFLPQELSGEKMSHDDNISLGLTVYRLDFSATIKNDDGTELVIIIEVQKARMYGDMPRFRRYLGKQYMNANLSYIQNEETGKPYKVGIPIYSIYFLGENLAGYESIPIVRISMEVTDRTTGEKLDKNNDFIKSLYHEGTIINIQALKGRRREELENILAIFDQSNKTKDMHILNVKEENYPVQFRHILNRLKQAVQVKEVRDVMELEDEFVKEIYDYEDRITREIRLKEEAQRRQEEAQRKQEEERTQKVEAILMLLSSGISPEAISNQLQLPLEYIQSLRK